MSRIKHLLKKIRKKDNLSKEEVTYYKQLYDEVHDLDNEQTNCQIDEIIAANHDVYYDALAQAHADGYDNGHYCIGGSTR